jgi:tryptophan synthase alpha subunit
MTSSNQRLAAVFERLASTGRTALIPYIAAGDPSLASTPALMHAMVGAGADVIELGVPFSDPMADGPVIQRAAERAIARGAGLRQVFDMVRAFRQKDTQTPVVLMGYANPIEHMGQAAFASEAAQAGVDGVLVVDYPPEETVEFAAELAQVRVDPIFLLAPTSTEDRIRKIAEVARGYVYYVSLKGVTGAGPYPQACNHPGRGGLRHPGRPERKQGSQLRRRGRHRQQTDRNYGSCCCSGATVRRRRRGRRWQGHRGGCGLAGGNTPGVAIGRLGRHRVAACRGPTLKQNTLPAPRRTPTGINHELDRQNSASAHQPQQ